MKNELNELHRAMVRRIRETHGVPIAKDDPLLISVTANHLGLEQLAKAWEEVQAKVLDKYQREFEELNARWVREADAVGMRITRRMLDASTDQLEAVAQRTSEALEQHIESAGRVLARELRRCSIVSRTLLVVEAVLVAAIVMRLL